MGKQDNQHLIFFCGRRLPQQEMEDIVNELGGFNIVFYGMENGYPPRMDYEVEFEVGTTPSKESLRSLQERGMYMLNAHPGLWKLIDEVFPRKDWGNEFDLWKNYNELKESQSIEK